MSAIWGAAEVRGDTAEQPFSATTGLYSRSARLTGPGRAIGQSVLRLVTDLQRLVGVGRKL